jgi:hypothetical protein
MLLLKKETKFRYRSIGWVSGVFKSFGDAEVLAKKERNAVLGAEYSSRLFCYALGYFHESPGRTIPSL